LKENILPGSKWDCKGYISRKRGDIKDGFFSFQAKSVRTNKF
jgi:primosomal replication protein N